MFASAIPYCCKKFWFSLPSSFFPQVDGQVVLRFAYAYGFRNIQSILAKARRAKCPYQFVEVMACPSGCVNGGGQIKPSKKERADDTRQRVEKVCAFVGGRDALKILENRVSGIGPTGVQQ